MQRIHWLAALFFFGILAFYFWQQRKDQLQTWAEGDIRTIKSMIDRQFVQQQQQQQHEQDFFAGPGLGQPIQTSVRAEAKLDEGSVDLNRYNREEEARRPQAPAGPGPGPAATSSLGPAPTAPAPSDDPFSVYAAECNVLKK